MPHLVREIARHQPPVPVRCWERSSSQIFDKTVRALENAVNRLPGMHDMGLENLLLEEPAPPMPSTPGSGAQTPAAKAAAAAAVDAATAAAAAAVVRPTAPGKSSIPWEHNAVGPLSQLARQVRKTKGDGFSCAIRADGMVKFTQHFEHPVRARCPGFPCLVVHGLLFHPPSLAPDVNIPLFRNRHGSYTHLIVPPCRCTHMCPDLGCSVRAHLAHG